MYRFCSAIWFHVPTKVTDDDAAMDITFNDTADVKPSDMTSLADLFIRAPSIVFNIIYFNLWQCQLIK